MLKEGTGAESVIIVIWVLITFIFWALGTIMKNSGDGHKNSGGGSKNGFLPSSFRAVSSYLRIVSSGASTVARSAASVAQSIVDRDDASNPDQVLWAGFDKLESECDVSHKVLLLGYCSGFQVWDVEEADNVYDLVSRHDCPVTFLQMLPKPARPRQYVDKFAENRPLLVLLACGAASDLSHDGISTLGNGGIPGNDHSMNDSFVPNIVRFYSLRSQSYVHEIKFRSVVHTVRCSSRIVAILQSNQIHCFNSTTLEKEYTLITNPIMTSAPGARGIGYGPLAVGPRWLAYSGSPVAVNSNGRVSAKHLTSSASFSGFPSNGSLVAHYAKESSKHLAAGIVNLGDMGYKKLTRYCSELLPDSHRSVQSANLICKGNGTLNAHFPDADSIGMVVVRDIVSKVVISQFRAHKSPISALCFDPSGMLLVTASVQGHNINIFKIIPGSLTSDSTASHVHLHRLQRGFTNAVIQDICFSDDDNWIMISSSRGTSHLFAIDPLGGSGNFPSYDAGYSNNHAGLGVMTRSDSQSPSNICSGVLNQHCTSPSSSPIALSAVGRIRNGYNGWKGTVTGAAAAAMGRMGSLPGAIASSFHNSKADSSLYRNGTSSKAKCQLLVFSPSGSMIQYALRVLTAMEMSIPFSQLSMPGESSLESDGRLVVEPIQKWNICHTQSQREREDNTDIYGENGYSESNKIYPAGLNGDVSHPQCFKKASEPKFNLEEKHPKYISEAELQMHQARNQIWAKPEICFQPILTGRVTMDDDNTLQGEIEIERFPTCVIEVRSKNLVPIFDYAQSPKFQYARAPATDCNCNVGLQHQRSVPSEEERLSRRTSSGSIDSMSDGFGMVTELQNGVEGLSLSSIGMPIGSRGIVNINDSRKSDARLDTVNSRGSSMMEAAQLKFVNSNGGWKTETHLGGSGEEYH